jgi:glutathione S-transferase
MKLYDGGRAPNPRRVRIFLAEKGMDIPLEPVDLDAAQSRAIPRAQRRSRMRSPALRLTANPRLTTRIFRIPTRAWYVTVPPPGHRGKSD